MAKKYGFKKYITSAKQPSNIGKIKKHKKGKEINKNNIKNENEKEDEIGNEKEDEIENEIEDEIESENEDEIVNDNENETANGDKNEKEKEKKLLSKKYEKFNKVKKEMKNTSRKILEINNINYYKELLKFILNEYSGTWKTSFLDIVFDITHLKNIKIIYYVLLSLYNLFKDKNKSIASMVLLCVNLIKNN